MWLYKKQKDRNNPDYLHDFDEHRIQSLKAKHLKSLITMQSPIEISGFAFLNKPSWKIQKKVEIPIDSIPMI